MRCKDISLVLGIIRREVKSWGAPTLTQIAKNGDPFRVLVGCILSSRTRDEVTENASKRLFALAGTPEKMLKTSPSTIRKAIYPVAFYKVKSKTILQVCRELIEQYNGCVPDSLGGLLKLKGVGRKTANLTLILGYKKSGICVDTHVHRITNRWGYLSTRKPEETEIALRERLPKRYWMEINDLLVTFGKNCCKPLSPHCSSCCVEAYCKRYGVLRSR